MLITRNRARKPIALGRMNSKGMSGMSPLGSGMEGPCVTFAQHVWTDGKLVAHTVTMTLAEFDELAQYVAETRRTFGG